MDKNTNHNGETLVEVNHLVKYFPVRAGLLQRVVNQVKAVDDVSFIVKKGETLGKVAQCYLGDPIRFYALARYNAIAVPRTIPAGTKLKIPTAFKAKVKRCK